MTDYDTDDFAGIDIESAAGWQPEYKHQKLLDDYRKKHPPIHPEDNLLDVRPANDWMHYTGLLPASAKLFGDLWKEGEL